MKNKIIKKLSLLIVFVMLSLVACVQADPWADAIYTKDTEFGEGNKTVIVDVCVKEHSVAFTIHTDAKTLGEALLEHNLIEGEESQFGIYIKKVNGILADYDIDGSYWGFYDYNGGYMNSGVDTTNIEGGEHFRLVYEK